MWGPRTLNADDDDDDLLISQKFIFNYNHIFLPSVRDGDTVKHYRIRQLDEGGFFIARRATFRTLAHLVEHYTSEADGLCVNLRKPCTQVLNVCVDI